MSRSRNQLPIIAMEAQWSQVSVLPNFDKVFILETNASNIGISVMWTQEDRFIEYFNKKLSAAK